MPDWDSDWTPPPQRAYFSGYFIIYQPFKKLVMTMRPLIAKQVDEGYRVLYLIVVAEYDAWKSQLPKDERVKVPRVKVFDKDQDEFEPNDKVVFFPTRYVPAPLQSEIDDYPEIKIEDEISRAHRDELIALIARHCNNFVVDKADLEFSFVKDVHPYHDPLRGIC